MDSKFLEFYGNFLLNAAQGQKQFEELSDWLHEGYNGFMEIEDALKKYNKMTGFQNDINQDKEELKQEMDSFFSSFSTHVKQMGWIPEKEHNDLKKKYETLKKKIVEQQKTIDQLNHIMGIHSHKGYKEYFQEIQTIGNRQNKQLQDVMRAMGQAFVSTTGEATD